MPALDVENKEQYVMKHAHWCDSPPLALLAPRELWSQYVLDQLTLGGTWHAARFQRHKKRGDSVLQCMPGSMIFVPVQERHLNDIVSENGDQHHPRRIPHQTDLPQQYNAS